MPIYFLHLHKLTRQEAPAFKCGEECRAFLFYKG